MLIKTEKTWKPNHLDAHCPPDSWRIQVQGWLVIEVWDDAQIVVPKKLSTLIDYTKRVGLVETARKVASRLKDSPKHRQCVAIGFGHALHTPAHRRPTVPDTAHIGFIIGGVPMGMARVVVPDDAITILERAPCPVEQDTILWRDISGMSLAPTLRGYPLDSGHHHDPNTLPEALKEALTNANWRLAETIQSPPTDTSERREPTQQVEEPDTKRLILFGHGHYARTCIVPHLEHLTLSTIHESNPTIIPQHTNYSWDTAPHLRPQESGHAVWIAGYHHTHAPIAVDALKREMWAVIEKPVVTTRPQLQHLVAAMTHNPRVLLGFHRRWAAPSMWIKDDLLKDGAPCHYHCIVHEVPLPTHHWYRWPNSRSRVLSNGCHWIDHFLWLNDYAPVNSWSIHGKTDHLMIWIELENDAMCSIVLSDEGSSRLGVRDVIECRANTRTVRWIDGASYESEDRHRILRTQQVNPMDAYPKMVKYFCAVMDQDDVSQAEPLNNLLVLHDLLLDLDECASSLTTQ